MARSLADEIGGVRGIATVLEQVCFLQELARPARELGRTVRLVAAALPRLPELPAVAVDGLGYFRGPRLPPGDVAPGAFGSNAP